MMNNGSFVVGGNPGLKQISCSHSISSMKTCLGRQYGDVEVLVTPTNKDNFFLEFYRGAFFRWRYDPRTTLTRGGLLMVPPGEDMGGIGSDELKQDDYAFVVETYYSEPSKRECREKIWAVMKSNEFCRRPLASMNPALPSQAQGISRLCLYSYILAFNNAGRRFSSKEEAIAKAASENDPLERTLREGVEAGRELVDLLRAKEFVKGNLYNYEPTKNYVRLLYMLGSYLVSMNKKTKEAYDILQECLANDINDKLGARHKQLLIALDGTGSNGEFDERLHYLLKAKFGEDQLTDEITALWNYTRALYTYASKGSCKKSKRFLNHAIDMNPHVPPLLLCWESEKSLGMNKLIQVGHEGEAIDYCQDNRTHWEMISGALDWLDAQYAQHKKAKLPKLSKQGRQLLSKANRLLATRKKDDMKAAIGKYEDLIKVAEEEKNQNMCAMAHEHIGCCYKYLGDSCLAVEHFKTVLAKYKCELKADKDLHREVLYQLADSMEEFGHFEVALKCYKIVFDEIGAFSTAYEGVKRIEQKMGQKSGVIPSNLDRQPSPMTASDMEHNMNMNEMADQIMNMMAATGSKSDSITPTMERCYHCDRGGIKLMYCSLCNDDKVLYCSKDCSAASWRQIHKYTCKGSKRRALEGQEVTIKDLVASSQYNGKKAKVVRFVEEKKRFVIVLEADGSKMLAKPQNLQIERKKQNS